MSNASHMSTWAVPILQTILHHKQAAYICTDEQLCIQAWSDNVFDMLGLPPTPLAQLPLTEIVIELVGLEEHLHAILKGTLDKYHLETIMRPKHDGSMTYLSLNVFSLHINEQPPMLLVLVEDTTALGVLRQRFMQERNELRLLQDQLQTANQILSHLNEFKSRMLSMAAHDLRAPLSAILRCTELLTEEMEAENAPPTWQNLLARIDHAAQHMQTLLNSLLDEQRYEAGRLVSHKQPTALNVLVRQLLTLFSPTELERIQANIPDAPVWADVDPLHVQQIVYNLVDNALKYTPAPRPITIEVGADEQWRIIRVRDEGRGIPPQQLQRLLGVFERQEESQHTHPEGAGLGLFIVKSLVDAHHGELHIESEPNKGTTFTVCLPPPS